MADLLGAMRVEIVGDNTKLDKSINDSQKNTKSFADNTAKLGSTLGKLFTGIGFAVVAKKLFDLGKAAENMFQIQEAAEAKLDATLLATGNAAGLTAEELKLMASELQGVTKFGDEATIGAQSLLLTFKEVGEDVFPRALESILDVSEAMGQDLKTSTVQIGKALNDPVAGLAALSRVGIQFSDVQKDLIKGFQENGDLASAQGVILEELESQFGGVARAAALTSEGIEQQLNNSIGDLQETIGGIISNAMSPWRKSITGTIDDINNLIKTQILEKKILSGEATLVEELIHEKSKLSDAEREIARRKETLAIRQEQLNNITDIEISRSRTSREAMQKRIDTEAEAIVVAEYNQLAMGENISTLEEQIRLEKEAQQEVIDLALKTDDLTDSTDDLTDSTNENREATKNNTDAVKVYKKTFEQTQKDLADSYAEYAEARIGKNEEIEESENNLAATIADSAQTIADMYKTLLDQRVTNAEAALETFLSINETEIEALEAKADTEEGLNADEKARLDELNEERKELAMDQYEQQVKLFNAQKAISIAQTIVDGAQAAMASYRAFASIPYVGVALGAAAAGVVSGIATASAITIAAEEPPPPPTFANGGIVAGSNFIGDNVPALVNSGEMILNRSQQARLFELANNGSTTNNNTTNSSNININNMFSLGNEDQIRQAAKTLYPALIQEGQRRGAS